MADISILGFLQSSKVVNNGNNISIVVDEYQPAYTHTKTNEHHDAHMIRWNIVFPKYFIKFIKTNFFKGMLVKVKGIAKPFPTKVIVNNDNEEDTFEQVNVMGETIVRTFNAYDLNKDKDRENKSQKHINDVPNLQDFLQSDF